jgi:hypothetical protein
VADSGAFWGAIVQVVPVLYIAVMIEFRYLFARAATSDRMFKQTRGLRFLVGLMLAAVTALLATAFLASLDALRLGLPTSDPTADIAVFALQAAAGVALGPPGFYLFVTSTSDVWVSIHRKTPWSSVYRDRHELVRLRAKNDDLRRTARTIRLELLVHVSQTLVRASAMDRASRGLPLAERAVAWPHVMDAYGRADRARAQLQHFDSMIPPLGDRTDFTDLSDTEVSRFRERLAQEAARASA